jgi:hypothetical protein
MKALHIALFVLVGLITAAPAAGGATAQKQRVAIDVRIIPNGKFALTPLKAGALKPDSGASTGDYSTTPVRVIVRDGQEISIHTGSWTFTGNRGTLVIRERNEWVDIGSDLNGDGLGDGVAFGFWKVVRGTGQYAGLAGGGRSGHAGLGQKWNARYEGLLTAP